MIPSLDLVVSSLDLVIPSLDFVIPSLQFEGSVISVTLHFPKGL